MADPSALAAVVGRLTATLREDGPYRPPTPGEAADVVTLADALAAADPVGARAAADRLGLTEAAPSLLTSDARGARSWLLLVAPVGVPGVVVQVPHPHSDLGTERVGLALLAALPDALYLQCGAHRRAGAPPGARERDAFPADPAARADSAFALLADRLVARLGMPQVQVHGFADRPDRDFDVVVSSGAARSGPLLAAVVATLRCTGERVRLGGDPDCADLSGNLNVQGRSAARHGTAFVHLELSRSLRRDGARRAAVTGAVADAIRFGGASPPV